MSGRIKRLLLVILLVPLWVFLRSVYRDRIGAFGCFDDCFNYMGGYFILAGKRLFSEIFFNHMPLMAYISAAIQFITKPDSIYMLLYEHRMFMIYAAIAANVVLVLRFGLVGFGFSVLYETTKGYLFGERFLAEGLIMYPLVYLFGFVWEELHGKKIASVEFMLSAILAWFIVFMREPYIPLVIALFGITVWHDRRNRMRVGTTLVMFILLSILTIGMHDVGEFWFNVVSVNMQSVAKTEVAAMALGGWGIVSIVFYPFLVFFGGTWNIFRVIEAALSVFLISFGIVFWRKQDRKFVFVSFVILTLANVRPIIPGSLYYGSFHHLVWFALALAAVLFFAEKAWREQRRLYALGTVTLLAGLTVYNLLSPASFLRETVDRQTEITTNYAQYYAPGETIRRLSAPGDTLFLEEWDDLIYWQAKVPSSYRYAWYTSVMPQFEPYRQAREEMFAATPPTFYYGKCTKISDTSSLPSTYEGNYVRLMVRDKPSCLWVHKEKIGRITDGQWESAVEFGYRRSL